VNVQSHASPGIYTRTFLWGMLAMPDSEDVDKEILSGITALNLGINSARIDLGPISSQGINYVEGASRAVFVG
jgi:hypothetical protein